MKRLALVLAAALLGTGCGPNCPTGTTLVSWTGFDGPGASDVNRSCAGAGVLYVDVFLDDQPMGRWPCGDYGAAVAGVPTGGNILTVEGIAGDGSTILFRDDFPYTQRGCGDVALQAFPGAGSLDLHYTFESGSACSSSTSFIWFTLFDRIASLPDPSTIDATSSLATKQTFACGPTDPVVTLPVGRYDLDFITEQTETALGSGLFTQTASGCKLPTTFTIASRAQTVVSPSLADTGVACLP